MLTDLPLLLCMNLQNEFLAEYCQEWAAVLDLCLAIQLEWRTNMWPVAHLKRTATAAYFNSEPHLTDWIARAKPLSAELTFEHSLPSAYSSTKFREYMAHIRPARSVVVGFSLHESIVSTVIDGYHRGDRFEVIGPAVGCNPDHKNSLKPPILEVLKSFSKVLEAPEIKERY